MITTNETPLKKAAHQMRLEQAQRLILSAMVFPALRDIERKYPDLPRLNKVWAAVREAEQELAEDEESRLRTTTKAARRRN